MIDQRVVILGSVVAAVGGAAYVRNTLRGTSRPNRATFALWALAGFIAGVAELTKGVGWAAVPTLVAGLTPALIVAASFIGGAAPWRLGLFDYGCAGLSILALMLWRVSGSGSVAIAFSIAADLLAALPTVRKCYTHPGTETGWAYVAGAVNGLTGVLAAQHVSFDALGFNVYLVLLCGSLSLLVLWPRSKSCGVDVRRPATAEAHAMLLAVAGAGCIAGSASLVRFSGAEPATVAVFRCAYALPLLALIASRERIRSSPRDIGLGVTGGVFFSADLVLWHHSIADVGGALATVLGNLQVIIVAVAAWLIFHERPSRRLLAALPAAFCGVVLISGVGSSHSYGADPARGVAFGAATSIAYAGYLLLLREAARPGHLARPLLIATASSIPVSAGLGALTGGISLVPRWPSHGWLALLACTSQVLGWLLISRSLPQLPAATTALLLLVQPAGALFLGYALFGETPVPLQLTGVLVVLAAVTWGSTGRTSTSLRTETP